MRARPRFRALRIAAAVAVLAVAGSAPAAPPQPLAVQLFAREGRVVATVDLSAAFPPTLEREMRNGLTNVVAVYVTVIPAGGRHPAMLYGRVLEILFDVWDRTYSLTVKDAHVPQGVRFVLADFKELRSFLSQEHDLDLGPVSLLPQDGFFVEARVAVNPISKEQLERTREFIANPPAGSREGGSRSILAPLVSYLLRAPDADVTLLRSGPLGPGEVKPR